MAKIVTLKSPNAEDIYPVTDASGIRVTGNVTLQQALDGFVYADDPTAPANPDGWITPSDIDWDTFNYSTTEQRVGTWIDGKPIYKQTYQIPSGPSSETSTVYISVPSSIDQIINYEGFLASSNLTIYIGTARAVPGASTGFWYERNNNQIALEAGTVDRSGFSGYVTIYYTKTS